MSLKILLRYCIVNEILILILYCITKYLKVFENMNLIGILEVKCSLRQFFVLKFLMSYLYMISGNDDLYPKGSPDLTCSRCPSLSAPAPTDCPLLYAERDLHRENTKIFNILAIILIVYRRIILF